MDASSEYNGYGHNYNNGHHGQHYRQQSGVAGGYGGGEQQRGHTTVGGGGTVSALSGGGESHEAQKQWDWLEEVLDKSSRNKETVSVLI